MITVRKEDGGLNKANLEMLTISHKTSVYKITYTYVTFKKVVVTSDQKQMVLAAVNKKSNNAMNPMENKEMLLVYSMLEGKLISTTHPKYSCIKEWKKVKNKNIQIIYQ